STMQQILAQGNEIGNHSLRHEQDPSTESLQETNRLIRRATGFRPCDFRPPDGAVNGALISRAHALHMTTVNWDVDPRDWATPGVGAIASNVIQNAHNGSIVVMHDGGGDRSQTVAALPAILSHFRHRGYQFVTVAELLGHQFSYPPQPSSQPSSASRLFLHFFGGTARRFRFLHFRCGAGRIVAGVGQTPCVVESDGQASCVSSPNPSWSASGSIVAPIASWKTPPGE